MTSTHFANWEESIHRALDDQAAAFENTNRGQWQVDFDGTGSAHVDVQLKDEWVLCSAPIASAAYGDDLEPYLWAVPTLPGSSKVALTPGGGALEVREEVPVVNGIDVGDASTRAIVDVVSARELLVKPERVEPGVRGTSARGSGGRCAGARKRKRAKVSFAGALREASEAAGWGYTERDDSTPVVTLELSDACYQAIAESRGRNDHRLAVTLALRASFTDLARRAVAQLLLTANGLVRFARAGIERSGGGAHAVIETRFSGQPSAALLDTAISALAVACGLSGREVSAMRDEKIARRFLEARSLPVAPAASLAAVSL